MSKLKSMRLSEDIVLLVYMGVSHTHVSIGLILSESSDAFVLHSFATRESFKEKVFRWKLEGQKLEDAEERFFDEVERLGRS